MADQDTTVNYENGEKVEDEVETTQVEDEKDTTQDTESQETDTGKENEEESDESDGKTETEKEEEAEFKRRFNQFEGETLEEYVQKLEDAYANSSTEGQRNSKEAKEAKAQLDKVLSVVANNPEFAKALEEGKETPAQKEDPALAYARQQMEADYARDWQSFVTLHPEVADDKALQQELIEELDIIGDAAERRGRQLSMEEGLRKAWISLGKAEADKKEDVVNKTKQQASKGAPGASKPKSTESKKEFTPEQIAVAKKMGVTPEQLAKYSK